MADRRDRPLTADERLAQLAGDRARLRRERMIREVAGPRWRRMVRITPALFDRAGTLAVRRLLADRTAVIEALSPSAVFAVDTAMRLERGHGYLTGGDVFAYVNGPPAIDALVRAGLVSAEEYPDAVLVRPWPGPPRLLAALVDEPPPWVRLPSGHRVVTKERQARELIGTVGARSDLFALLEAGT